VSVGGEDITARIDCEVVEEMRIAFQRASADEGAGLKVVTEKVGLAIFIARGPQDSPSRVDFESEDYANSARE
jgi:hypothetical protein